MTMTHVPAADLARTIGVDPSVVRHHCRKGHLPGAVKLGRDWLVPADLAEPGAYRDAVGTRGRGSANRKER